MTVKRQRHLDPPRCDYLFFASFCTLLTRLAYCNQRVIRKDNVTFLQSRYQDLLDVSEEGSGENPEVQGLHTFAPMAQELARSTILTRLKFASAIRSKRINV